MGNLLAIPSQLKNRPFSYAEAVKCGLTQYSLQQMLLAGVIEQIARGIYQAAGGDIDEESQFRVATLRVGLPSAICVVSALSFYGLTDAISRKTWIMVPTEKRTVDPRLRCLRSRNPQWKSGIEKHEGYFITSLERTIVDSLIYKKLVGHQIGLEALKSALKSKKTNLGRVLDMATKLKVDHRIRDYLEVFSL